MIPHRVLLLGALGLLSLPSCTVFDQIAHRPKVETPTSTSDGYLQGGPNTDVELGAGERSLLEDYKILHDSKLKLETQLSELDAVSETLRERLASTEEERDILRTRIAGAEQEGTRMAHRTNDLEAKVLSLNIEKTLLEQELMRMRIGSLREQYEQLTAVPGAAPLGSTSADGGIR